MAFDPIKERERVLSYIRQALPEPAVTDDRLERVNKIANEEVDKLVEAYNDFEKTLKELCLHDVSALMFSQSFNMIFQQIRYMINKDYTQEELQDLPEDVYDNVVVSQQRRSAYYKSIAKKYDI